MNEIGNGAGWRIPMHKVGTRDGLQAQQAFVPDEAKIALVDALSEAGMAKIDLGLLIFASRRLPGSARRAGPAYHLWRVDPVRPGR